jgi:FtsP/CotA-like multicopper oxidase with cupredoxin domain
LQDWAHLDFFNQWWWNRPKTGPPPQHNSLINGTNVFDCKSSNDTRCIGNGTRFEMNFVKGKKYRLRLVNTGLYSHFRFAIDGHNLTVIAMDFVPIVPYTTDNVCLKPLGMGVFLS